jgi:hypothetical protein
VSRKTTTTTVVHSEKDADGNWSEFAKTITTVVERDDEGYPYGPVPLPKGLSPYGYGPYFSWDYLGRRSKPTDQEDGQNG